MGTEFGLSGVMGRGLLGYMRFSCTVIVNVVVLCELGGIFSDICGF